MELYVFRFTLFIYFKEILDIVIKTIPEEYICFYNCFINCLFSLYRDIFLFEFLANFLLKFSNFSAERFIVRSYLKSILIAVKCLFLHALYSKHISERNKLISYLPLFTKLSVYR